MKKYKAWLFVLVLGAMGGTLAMDLASVKAQMFTALVLLPLSIAAILGNKLRARELGLLPGAYRVYLPAIAYPVFVAGVLIGIMYTAGNFGHKNTLPGRLVWVVSVNALVGIVGVLLTEELFFRGACWSLLKRLGHSDKKIVLLSGVFFLCWHLPVGFFEFGAFSKGQLPVYFINAFLLALNWGLLRLVSGSVWVSSVSHAFWNAMSYSLFGFGDAHGFFLSSFYIFDPERGWLGIPLNLLVFFFLVRLAKNKGSRNKTVLVQPAPR